MAHRSSGSAFLPDVVDVVMDQACRRVGLDPCGAELLRLGENMLFRLSSAPVVVRVARDLGHLDDAAKEVAVSDWLAAQHFPAARTFEIPDQQQPLVVDGHPVTFWRFIPGRPANIDEAGILGGLLRRLHQLERPEEDLDLPPVNGFGHIPARLAGAPIPDADKDFLRHRVAELEQELAALEFRLPATAIHGDAHVKNIMIAPDGAATLIDLEAFAYGFAEWDLAKTAAETSMGMLAERDYEAFAEAYGYDITSWSGFTVLRQVMQVKMITWLAQNVDHSERIATEYAKRIATIRTGVLTEPWRGF
ncbi:phosphotransferase enzyme family protein [Nocardia sp. NPDC050408]|uniref:phosphotransferase enzyme family protein n=1 Tax=Nocardia sp. NPDC050408 TaxID=3364319 RepID=UPI003797D868